MRTFALLSALVASPLAAQDITPDPQCSLLLMFVLDQHDRICADSTTSISAKIDATFARYVEYFVRNSDRPRTSLESEFRDARLAPAPDDYHCETAPVGQFHARFVTDPTRLSQSVDIHLAEDRPVEIDFAQCFPGLRN